MKHRYFIIMQFKGKNYHGWQIQPNAPTIQAEINNKLGIILQSEITTIGAGRTDTGVHARYFAAHFNTDLDIDEKLGVLCSRMNQFLPSDISIIKIVRVAPDAHARFDAINRTYKYYISRSKNVFNREFSWHVFCNLDIVRMNEGSKVLMQYTDFKSFSKFHSDVKTYNCKIMSAGWENEDDQLVFTITADRFLRNMVRSIVGTLIMFGRHKIDLVYFRSIIEARDRSKAGESVPAHGLFLHSIEYPYPL
jgi:tRNA pseudouridine38-40 synthase